MNIAIYIRHLEPSCLQPLQQLVDELQRSGVTLWMPDSFMRSEAAAMNFHTPPQVYPDGAPLPSSVSFLLSVGGDGTLLSSVHLIAESARPVLGINFGHLGFLTAAGREDVQTIVKSLQEGDYKVEQRSLLHITHAGLSAYALNEVALHRGSHLSLLRSSLFVAGEYVASYAADGLIVATPTGSTAYSLSCGGPILTPDSHCLVITPIAAHTLTLRPIIIPDTSTLRIETPAGALYSLCIDSRTITADGTHPVLIEKAPFTLPLIRLPRQSFFTAIREKLNWGK